MHCPPPEKVFHARIVKRLLSECGPTPSIGPSKAARGFVELVEVIQKKLSGFFLNRIRDFRRLHRIQATTQSHQPLAIEFTLCR